MAKVLSLPDYSALKATLDDTYPAFPALREIVPRYCEGEEGTSCLMAAEEMFYYMAILKTYPQENSAMYVRMWLVHLHTPFVDMLARKHSISLIVLAHYAALMKLRSNTWWLCRWPSAVVQHVTAILDPALAVQPDWPRRKLLQLD